MKELIELKGGRKLRIGVVFGGRSGEHAVSLMSARSVTAALDRERYEVTPIGILPDGRWLTGGQAAALLGAGGADADTGSAETSLLPARQSLSEVDVIFPVLHGPYGEDGTVQGMLELANLPYVGAGVVGSAVGMDKGIFKQVMTAVGLPVLPWELVTRREWEKRPSAVLDKIEAKLSYPVFTKPANLGSSVGISKCKDRAALEAGIAEAARHDRRLVVEQGIEARELEVAVLGNEEPEASIVGEIRPRREFYDYVAKYEAEPGSEEESELLIPAALDTAVAEEVRRLAVRAYQAIDCAGLGRVDFLLDKENGRLYINEINTIPGFTRISMYPKLWEATGLSYPALLDRLVALALDRHEEK